LVAFSKNAHNMIPLPPDFSHCLTISISAKVQEVAGKIASRISREAYYSFLSTWFVLALLKQWHYWCFDPLEPDPACDCKGAELELSRPTIGKIGCLFFLPGQQEILVPPSESFRFAYVAVYFDGKDPAQAQIAGFAKSSDVCEVSSLRVDGLREIDQLLDYLARAELAADCLGIMAKTNPLLMSFLKSKPLSLLISLLESIYCTYPEYEWRGQAGDALFFETFPELKNLSPRPFYHAIMPWQKKLRDDFFDLGEVLMERMAELW